LVLVAAGAVTRWWWLAAATVEPPLPAEIPDAEVRLAIENARQHIHENPRSAEAWGRLGLTLLAHLYHNEADQCFAEASHLAPNDPHWPYARALNALKCDPNNALTYLRQAAAHADSWPVARSAIRMQLAQQLLARRQLDEAEQLFQEELRRSGRSDRASLGLGLVAAARGNNRAATMYLTAVRGCPYAHKNATVQLAVLAGIRGDATAVSEYEKDLETAKDKEPGDPPWPDPLLDELRELRVGFRFWERRVEALEHENRYAEAAAFYLQQIRNHPTSRAYEGAGTNFALLHDYAKALPLLRKAVEADPNSAPAHFALAVTLFARWNYEMGNNPNATPSNQWLEEAIEHARRTTELQVGDTRGYQIWGNALMRLGQPAAAVEPLRRGVACRPEDFDLQLSLGQALLQAGNIQEAEIYLVNACQLRPDNALAVQALDRLRGKRN
jgi:tetratricopeptide (TPR) repeat protein